MIDPITAPPTIVLRDGACLRPLRDSDAEAWLDCLADPAVTERTSYPEPTAAFVEGMITRCRTRWAGGELSKWALALDDGDRFVGTCGFNDGSRPHRWAELAYELARPQWGTGLMSRAVTAVLDWGFSFGEIDRVQAYVRIDNTRSARLLARAGFVHEGRLRSYRVCRGVAHDFDLHALLRRDRELPSARTDACA